MMKLNKLLCTLAAAAIAVACDQNHDPIVPDTPKGQYEQLTFSSDDEPSTRAVWNDEKGSGSLIFNWEADEDGTEMVALLTDGKNFICNYLSANPSEEDLQETVFHTYMTIEPKDDLHKADFKTLRYYNKEDKDAAKAVFAVTPVNDFCIFEADKTSFSVQMEMPEIFVQTESQHPEFLSDYMMMYGLGEFVNGSATIPFKHIPATFRFIITNKRPTTAKLESVSLSIDGEASVGSNFAEVYGDYTIESLDVDFAGNHKSITTLLNTTLASQEVYTAYAMALPLGNNETLEGKDIKFVINTAEHGFLSFVLKGSQIAQANPNGEYNWVGGKSYTIRMSLDDVLTFEGISVTDWTDGGTIDGGEAEELWTNGFNTETGEYEPATLNADGYYEMNNAGNLFWFAEQVNGGALGSEPFSIKLMSDIEIPADMQWMPINKPDKTRSEFYGNGHTITINQSYSGTSNFGLFVSCNYSVVKDLTLRGEITVNTTGSVGVIAGSAYRTTLSRVTSYVNVTNSSSSGSVGGLVGYFGGQNANGENSLVENCAVYADITGGANTGGLIGEGWNGQQYYYIRNSLYYGNVTNENDRAGAIVGYHNTDSKYCEFSNVYWYEPDGLGFYGARDTENQAYTNCSLKTAEEFASEDMADLLNAGQETEVWEYVSGSLYPTLKK